MDDILYELRQLIEGCFFTVKGEFPVCKECYIALAGSGPEIFPQIWLSFCTLKASV